MMHKKRLIMYGKLQKVSKDFFFPKISMVDTGKADIVVGGGGVDGSCSNKPPSYTILYKI
jgi:hypothetical protein